jgi:glycosyltransferase involved in cell wall biosynthesis
LLLSIGGVEPRKNVLNMLEAFLRARRALPQLHWLIAGGASIFEHARYREQFAARLAQLAPAEARAVLRSGVIADADMPALYAASDLFLYASLHEGFGLCVLEAMAARRPVVVSRGAPFDEYLDERCALFTDPGDPGAIAWAIVHSLSCSRADQGRVERAFARAREFSWAESARRHDTLYRQALARAATGLTAKRREIHA